MGGPHARQREQRAPAVDTSRVRLEPWLEALIERLAASAHDIATDARRDDGAAGGAPRGDARRRGAGLASHAELGDAATEYERDVTRETLKAVLALGCRILPPGDVAVNPLDPAAAEHALHAPSPLSHLAELIDRREDARLVQLWRDHDKDVWRSDPELYVRLGTFFRGTDPMLAYEVFAEGLGQFDRHQRLRYSLALTLARMGVVDQPMAIARSLAAEPLDDPELLTDVRSLLARLHKDLALAASTREERRGQLELALAAYRAAFESAPDGCKSYPAVNAATIALLLDRRELAERLAAEARRHADDELHRADHSRYWQLATLGESAFIRGDLAEAERRYEEAVRHAGQRYDDVASMRRNARLIARHLGDGPDWVERILRIPTVVVFAGHMIDRPDAARPRFPAALARAVGAAVSARLRAVNAGFGFAGAACGSDILFLEAMRRLGGETHIILPFARERFLETSVGVTGEGNWVTRFDAALASATSVDVASGAPAEWGGIVFEYANSLLLGLATLKSRALDTDMVGLAVWDGRPGYGPGGTASTVAEWKRRGLRVEIIPIDGLGEQTEAHGDWE